MCNTASAQPLCIKEHAYRVLHMLLHIAFRCIGFSTAHLHATIAHPLPGRQQPPRQTTTQVTIIGKV